MKRIALLIASTVLLNGCATFQPSVPDGYIGPTASIKDTAKSIDSGKAEFFYLSHVGDRKIKNSRTVSRSASHGSGDFLKVVLLNNSVPAEENTFTIVGRTEYAMPARALAGTVYEVKGDVEFVPIPNEEYVVKGSLSEDRSAVWIERVSNNEVIERIEVEGSSKLGFFEK